MLLDTPGILWPKIDHPNSSYRLATTGAIKDTAMSYEDVAYFAAEFCLAQYPEHLKNRFNLSELPQTETELLEIIGTQRGCLRGGKRIDFERASTIFINELREGKLGQMTLETPEVIDIEIQQVAVMKVEKEALEKKRLEQKAARRRKTKANRR
jgi:ribosome biogenesis GTPase A